MKRKGLFTEILRADLKKIKESPDDPNVPNAHGVTPLMMALRRKNVNVTRAVLAKKNVDVNVANAAGDTALHVAVGQSFVEGVRLLLAAGADANLVNKAGQSPLTLAIERGGGPIVELLAPVAAPRFVDVRAAVRRGLAAVLERLPFEPNEVDRATGKTAVMYGYAKSAAARLDIIKLFLARGYALNWGDVDGWTLLSYEIALGSYENVQYLLDAGAAVADHMFALAESEELMVLLETWAATKGMLALDAAPAVEEMELALADDAQVFDPLMYCEGDLADVDLEENIVFAVLGADGKVLRLFAYFLPQLEKQLARKEFIFECAAEVTGSCPQLKDLVTPFVPYVQLMEACAYGVRADILQKLVRDNISYCVLFFDRVMPFCSSLGCIQVQYGFNYKGEQIDIVGRLHGKEGNDLSAYTAKIGKRTRPAAQTE